MANDMNSQFSKNGTDTTATGSIDVKFKESGRIYKIDIQGKITGPFEEGEVPKGDTLVEAIESGEIKIGDYVNFINPTSGSYPVTADKVGLDSPDYDGPTIDNPNKEQKYEITASKNQLNWRVLGVENGKAKLIAGSPLESDVTVEGKKVP